MNLNKSSKLVIASVIALSSSAMARAYFETQDFNFVAPIISDRANVPGPQSGLIVYDGSDDAFYGADANGNWQALSHPAANYLQSTSSAFALSSAGFASGEWAQMSGNSITLTPGSWNVSGTIYLSYTSTAPSALTQLDYSWSTVNGDNTSSTPTAATLDAGLAHGRYKASGAPVEIYTLSSGPVRITVASTTTIYLDTRTAFSTTGDATLQSYIYAEEIR